MSARLQFIERFRNSLESGTFVKLTLSDPQDANGDLRNVYARMVELKDGRRVQFVYRHARRDVTKNLTLSEAPETAGDLLRDVFGRGYLFTTTGDVQWKGPDEGSLKNKRATLLQAPDVEHDRPKVKAVTGAAWLTALGVTAPDGSARPGMADKLRQIERFVEILGHLVDDGPLREVRTVSLADLGAGKGYLTFAAYDFFQRRGVETKVTGVEVRADLVDTTNRVAREHGLDGLRFVRGDIASFVPDGSLDALVALHACDTATDDALHLGIKAGAGLILAAPCCHREVRSQIEPPAVLEPILRHGILLERTAETFTDAIRALLLEIHGYAARVFEFISSEHTGKNLMISAQRSSSPRDSESKRAQLRALLEFHGVRQQHLARLLGEL